MTNVQRERKRVKKGGLMERGGRRDRKKRGKGRRGGGTGWGWKKGMEDLPPYARTGEKREWRENKSAPSSIHGALMCHLTEIPPIRGIDLQSNAPLCACAWVWSCIMHEGEGGPASVSIREIAATSCRGKERKRTSCRKFIILRRKEGINMEERRRWKKKNVGSLIGQVKNSGDDGSFPGDN